MKPTLTTAHSRLASWALAGVLLLASGCYSQREAQIRFAGHGERSIRVAGLGMCRADGPDVLNLDPSRPLAVIVHGCTSSGERFRTLSGVFEAHGQQAICFNYDDRGRIDVAATQLRDALEQLRTRFGEHPITVLGHSQGGLVARRALAVSAANTAQASGPGRYSLVTISSPFSGIASSAHCGDVWRHVTSLSVTIAVCQAIAGSKWREIYPGSKFISEPGRLLDAVGSHLVISTDEQGSCRQRSADGCCAKDDLVFSLEEQRSAEVLSDARAKAVTLKAGHAAVVGENDRVPTKLIGALSQQGVLEPVAAPRRAHVQRLIHLLYVADGPAPAISQDPGTSSSDPSPACEAGEPVRSLCMPSHEPKRLEQGKQSVPAKGGLCREGCRQWTGSRDVRTPPRLRSSPESRHAATRTQA